MKLNLPNKLTLLRVFLIPVCMFFIVYPVFGQIVSPIIASVVFILTAFTDMLDGKIARKYNLITNFGKFLDPLADKLLIFGSLLAVIYSADGMPCTFVNVLFWGTFVIFLRELAVTSMRLVVSNGAKIVIAASWLGKIKTVTQMISTVCMILEPMICKNLFNTYFIGSYVTFGIAVIMTVWSGINYFIAYWPHLNPNK